MSETSLFFYLNLMKTFLKILLGIVVVIAAVVGIAFYATSGIVDVANKQLVLVGEGKIDEAYQQYTSKDFQAATSLEQFKAFVEAAPSFKNNKDSTFTSREISNDTGSLEGTLTGPDGVATPVKYALIKEGGEWKILNIDLPKAGATVDGGTATAVE